MPFSLSCIGRGELTAPDSASLVHDKAEIPIVNGNVRPKTSSSTHCSLNRDVQNNWGGNAIRARRRTAIKTKITFSQPAVKQHDRSPLPSVLRGLAGLQTSHRRQHLEHNQDETGTGCQNTGSSPHRRCQGILPDANEVPWRSMKRVLSPTCSPPGSEKSARSLRAKQRSATTVTVSLSIGGRHHCHSCSQDPRRRDRPCIDLSRCPSAATT